MARKKKPRRRMVYSRTFGFHDGAVIGCGPDRKPLPKRIKEDRIHIDEDGVFDEVHYSPTYWHSWDDDQRSNAVKILANRINTRRAIRELVHPELQELKSMLVDVREQQARIERVLAEHDLHRSDT